MKLYDVIITEEMLIKGVKSISLVENPATKSEFIALAEQAELVLLAQADKEKRTVIGALLVPDMPILRKGVPEDFYIKFSAETIENAQQFFFKQGFQNQSTIEHDKKPLEGNTVIESWIVEDTEKDKSALYNLSAPVGSWVIKMKIGNDDVWNNYVKTGKVKGFSIEGFFKPIEQTNLSEATEDTSEQIVAKIRAILGL